MITCEIYSSVLKKEWDSLAANSKAPLFFFQRDFMEYHGDRFNDHSLLFFLDGKAVAILPASLHENELVSHGGLTFGGLLVSDKLRAGSFLEIIETLRAHCKAHKIYSVVYKAIPYIFHSSPCQEDLYTLHRFGATLYKRELSSAINLNHRAKISKGRKWLINKAKKLPITIEESSDWESFHALLSEVLAKHNAKPVHTANELKYLHSLFPQNISLQIGKHDEKVLAAVLLFKFEGTTHTQYMATSEAGKEVGALDYLVESCIQEAATEGQNYFSFGISTEDKGTILNTGLIAQKESFGARGISIDTYQLTI